MNQPSALQSLMPLILIFGVFYLILIRPMQKKQKEHQAFLRRLKKGDRIVTNGGLHGIVQSVDDSTAVIKISDQVKVKVSVSAISGPQPDQGGKSG